MASKKLFQLSQYPAMSSLRGGFLNTGSSSARGFFGPPGKWDPFSDMTSAIREIERTTARMERDMDKFWTRSGMDRFLPSFSKLSPIGSSKEGMHRITMDLHGYKPEDVKVSLNDRTVTIEGKYEHKDDANRVYQEWSRQYTLPETADISKLKSLLDNEGVLTVEAPSVKKPSGEPEPKEIPIHKN